MDQHSVSDGRAGTRLGRWLTAGTGQLATLTALGGLLVALAYALGGWEIIRAVVDPTGRQFSWLQSESWAAVLLKSGNLALTLLGLAVALYTAYGIAGRPALIPALISGLTAMTINTGYLGGLAAGLIVGVTTRGLRRITVPPKWHPLMTRAVIPLVTTLFTAVVFFYGAVQPLLGRLYEWLYNKMVILELSDHHLWLGVVIGLVVCSDLGGAIYRIAFGFAVAGIASERPIPDHLTFMAVVVAAGMVPALGLSLATLVRRKAFTPAERGYGTVAWILGLAGIPEGAVPFALADPLRVIPAAMAGGAVTGVLTMLLGPTMAIPRAGVFAADQLGKPLLFAAAIAAGAVVTAGLTIGLKCLRREQSPVRPSATAASRAKVALPN
ncbi:fructose-specific PTS transporter subunit EIIC [Streptomyces sp. NPDC005811]|uniref:fructose-specific PTS transporter subunit EIIC n=1 Tax=Streptomyces sp. NPDC005811 TaxID=3154565 RepID=UPI0033D24B08